jgi:hypothetical protein
VFCGELAEGIENMELDGLCILVGLTWDVRDRRGGKVGAINGIVYRYSDFVLSVVVDDVTGNTSPHWLDNDIIV